MAGISTSNEAQIAAMLNLFEYLDYHMGEPGTDLRTLVHEAEQYLSSSGQLSESRAAMLDILKQGMDSIPGLADMRLAMSDHGSGIEADAFVSDHNEAYVVYRGTGDGKWIDNGRGMTEELTESQSQASDFYDRVVRECGLNEDTNLIVTGHSKGGNNAQSAALNAENRMLIDKCYSFDGQGMSDAAVERYSSMPGYEEQCRKLYGINNESDPVNELGIKVIPDENTVYIKTNTRDSDLVSTHAMEYLFYREDGTYGYTMNGETVQGELGKYAHRLSEILMSMPEELRDSCAVTLMQLIELGEDTMIGYDGDHATFTDASLLIHFGLPAIIYSIIGTEEGRDALIAIMTDAVNKYVEEHGVWETMGVITAIIMISPVIVPIIWPKILSAGLFIAGVVIVIDVLAALEQLGKFLEKVWSYIQDCLEAIEEFFEQISEWIKSKVTGRPIIKSADFSVNIDALRYAADELGSMRQALLRAMSDVYSVRYSLPMYGAGATAVKAYMDYVVIRTNLISSHIGSMERAIDRTANTYEQHERRIAGNAPAF